MFTQNSLPFSFTRGNKGLQFTKGNLFRRSYTHGAGVVISLSFITLKYDINTFRDLYFLTWLPRITKTFAYV